MLTPYKSKEFDTWFRRLNDFQAMNRINARIARICEYGEFEGDVKFVKGGVVELRFHGKGPGYHIYAAMRNGSLLLLLAGGDKSSQRGDIETASKLLADWDAQTPHPGHAGKD